MGCLWLLFFQLRQALCRGSPFALQNAGAHYHDNIDIITPSYCHLLGCHRDHGLYGAGLISDE